MGWLAQLRTRSHGFTRAAVVENALSHRLGEDQVSAMVRGLAAAESREQHLQVFRGGKRCFASEAAVFGDPPGPGRALTDWGERLFDGDYTLVVYRAEQFDDGFASAVAAEFAGLQAARGTSPAGQECFVFMGRYAQTPFGIHQDRDQGLTLHFHLGPGTKRMYTWSPEVYREATRGLDASHDLAALIDLAEVHDIPARSVFLLPAGCFHVAESSEFAVGVAVSELKPTRRRLLEQALVGLLDEDEDEGALTLDREVPLTHEFAAPELGLSPLPEESVQTAVLASLRDLSLRLYSNRGFTSPPHPIPELEPTGGQLRVHSGFPLAWARRRPGTLSVYCRGTRLDLPNNTGVVALLERLRTGTTLAWAEALALLADDFEIDAAQWLIGELVRRRGVLCQDPA